MSMPCTNLCPLLLMPGNILPSSSIEFENRKHSGKLPPPPPPPRSQLFQSAAISREEKMKTSQIFIIILVLSSSSSPMRCIARMTRANTMGGARWGVNGGWIGEALEKGGGRGSDGIPTLEESQDKSQREGGIFHFFCHVKSEIAARKVTSF